MWIIILVGSLLLLIHHYFIKPLKYWEDKKVQHEKPLPLFGNLLPFVIRKSSNVELFHQIYNNHPNARYVGMYSFTTPSLMIKDPDLIKKIMVKEFETFPEHRPFLPSDTDPLWSNNLFAMEGGEKWHQLRSTLSPSFTSSKMKAMFVLMKECSKEFLTYYKSKGDDIEVELKDAFARFGNDVIASTAFGVTCNSLANPKNEFYILGKEIAVMGGLRRLALLITLLSPTCAKDYLYLQKRVRQFFTTLVKDTLELRRKKHIVRPDMLHLLMESQKGNLTYEEDAPEAGFAVVQESEFGKVSKKSKLVVTDDIITSQVMIFFFAGFDTVSTMMSYTIYELALNPDIQERLREEIEDGVKLSNGEITYDNLMGMQFLDMVISDPELIKKIMVKEFETFPEHRPFISSDADPLWSNNLFAMEGGEKWHQLRSTLSPSFTSSKMKAMFVLMKECSKEFLKYYQTKGDKVEIELKDAFARFGNDVIATTAFGVTCNSLANPKNEFYILAKELSFLKGFRRFALLINAMLPTFSKIFQISLFTKRSREFFTMLVKDTLKIRRERSIIRPDMLHLLMESQKGNCKYEEDTHKTGAGFAMVEESDFGKTNRNSKLEITDEIITSQVMIFFFAGFDTVSTMMSYTIYELAINPDVQKRLREEIDDAVKLSNGEITYENLLEMKFLDMVISESLRKWPPFVMVDRRSARPYTIEPENATETPLLLEKHSTILCPVFSIHRDAKYYPNPDKFEPERFSEENRKNIQPYTYLPFGVGPRNCIGSRFALLEGKLIVAEIVKNFEIFPIAKTQNPIVFSKTIFNPLPDDGIWVGFKQRKLD
ncbi:hypothetical protein RI129_009546 [Pyrocoelia pectoralis]|uniref:Cytochrome P450 n=1 Tax=Pyrocoelia pectoralis TaxID=417401 RepID=A0AAN7VCR1_9COLE